MLKNDLKPVEIYGTLIFFIFSIIFCLLVNISMAYGFMISIISYFLFFTKKGFS